MIRDPERLNVSCPNPDCRSTNVEILISTRQEDQYQCNACRVTYAISKQTGKLMRPWRQRRQD